MVEKPFVEGDDGSPFRRVLVYSPALRKGASGCMSPQELNKHLRLIFDLPEGPAAEPSLESHWNAAASIVQRKAFDMRAHISLAKNWFS